VNISLLGDPLLLLIMAMAGFFSMATSLQVATRPAAVRTGLVATALTMGQLIFIVTRFGSLFYLPLLGSFVDQATKSGNTDILVSQVRWIIVGSAIGALVAFFLLPTFIELSCRGVRSIDHRGSLTKALLNLSRPKAWRSILAGLRRPSLLGVKLFRFEGIPRKFLFFNVVATSIWTVGAISAITVSGLNPQVKQTAILLSGLVNSFAAIAFSIWVDPQAAHITDLAKKGELKERHVTNASFHLVLGNALGSLLGLMLLSPALSFIGQAATVIGRGGSQLHAASGWLIGGNAFILLLAGTIYSSRISAVRTAKVATAIAVFNFFSLISRIAAQVYNPLVGAVTDELTNRDPGVGLSGEALGKLEFFNRGLIGGATLGCIISVLLIPTFVRIYDAVIIQMGKHGELSTVIAMACHPKRWGMIARTLTAPWKQAVSWNALSRIPKGFLVGNVVVLTFMTVGQLASIYAGAALAPEVARTATLLSPLINGVATVTLSIIVDPMSARIVDHAIKGDRPIEDVETMTFWLAMGSVVGTMSAQVLFVPAAWFIGEGAKIVGLILEKL
jgi:Alternate to MurJ